MAPRHATAWYPDDRKYLKGQELSGFDDITEQLQRRDKDRRYRRRRIVGTPQGRVLKVDGKQLLNFCSNDYLGLASNERIRQAFKKGVDKWGVGSGASHLVCGHTKVHHELENALAEFTERPRCLLFSSGYAANIGVINGLLTVGDRVFEDRLNHASLLDGGWISRAEFTWFAHRDHEDLTKHLDACSETTNRKLIVSDGTFSMDGDMCPLADLVGLARKNDAWLMIDDAHGFGVHGDEGRGMVDPRRYGINDVQVLVGTLGKAFGTQGAFVTGSDELIETLIQNARTYIYTTALPPAVAAATLESLTILRREGWRRERLRGLIARLREGVESLGLELMPSASPIQPVILGTEQAALNFSTGLEERGCLVTAIRPPTVPEGESRLRITLTAGHSDADVDQLLEAMEHCAAEIQVDT